MAAKKTSNKVRLTTITTEHYKSEYDEDEILALVREDFLRKLSHVEINGAQTTVEITFNEMPAGSQPVVHASCTVKRTVSA